MKANRIKAVSLIVAFCFSLSALDVKATINYGDVETVDFYRQFTYKWTDWQGIEHESDITEKADSPEQIIALIAKIFSDPEIPGTLTANPDENPLPTAEQMYANSDFDITFGYDNMENVTPPYKEGMTLLLVKVTDKWTINNIFVNGTADTDPYYAPNTVYYYEKNHCDAQYTGKSELYMFVSEAIESVQLVTSGVRIDDPDDVKNNGYVFNIQESLNKFFFISKGKQREVKNTSQLDYPFGWMFEEFSPTLNDGQDVQTDNVYDYISDGESYNIAHLCGSVLWQDHQFVLDKSHNASHDVNMCFYIPDYRLENWSADDEDVQGINFNSAPGRAYENAAQGIHTDNTYYHPLYYPKLFVYTAELEATTRKHTNAEGETGNSYDVTISWNVNLDEVVGHAKVDQQFYIYKVIDGIVQTEPFATVTGDDRSYTYQEEQGDQAQNITYIISASPAGAQDFPPVWSNEATITIPGVSDKYYLELSIDGAGSSIFDRENQLNYYANPLLLNNSTLSTPLTLADINDTFTTADKTYYYGSRIVIYRFHKANPEDRTRIASMNLRRLAPVEKYEPYQGKYLLYGVPVYYNQNVADLDNDGTADILRPNPTNISGQGGVGDLPANVLPVGSDGVIDFCNMPILDCFAESVADNNHASDYDYEAVFVKYPTTDTAGTTTDDSDAAASTDRSNIVTVKIQKTVSESGFNVHDESFVAADDNVSDFNALTPLNKGVKVSFTVKNNPRIKKYNVVRSDGTKVIVAQRASDGSYSLWQRGSDGSFNLSSGKFSFSAGVGEMEVWAVDDLREYENPTAELLDNLEYVVDVACKDVKSADATYQAVYGSEIIKPDYVNLQLKVHWKERLKEETDQSLYRLNKHGIVTTNSDDLVVDHYNIWRIHPDGTPEMIYPTSESVAASAAGYWFFNAKDTSYPEADACFLHADPFWYNSLSSTGTQIFNVKYLARAYLKKSETSAQSPQRSASARILASDRYVAEALLDVDYALGDNLQTAIETPATTEFSVSPTATDGLLRISGEGEMRLFNISGVCIMTVNDNEEMRTIDISALPAGCYLLTDGTTTKRILKK